jgi:hypothetical protein
MVAGGPRRPVCEVDRAYRELLGRVRAGTKDAESRCSPEPPVARDYPASRPPGGEYVLCNGHLRDLFDELALPPQPTTAPTPD